MADTSDLQECTTDADARVSYIGDANITFGSSGSGLFDSFVRIQGSPTESGYNTDGALQFDTKAGAFTHSMKLSEIPIRPCLLGATSGPLCWELFVDINESNKAPKISLNDVEVWLTTNPSLTGYVVPTGFPSGATKEYDFSGEILINDVNQGSGRGDLRYAIPLAAISIPAGCNYGNTACLTFFVLYSRWGTTSAAYASDGGFEEWKVKVYPVPNTTTTATQVKKNSDNTNIADGGSVAIGTVVYDTATLSGQTATAGGTVSYYVQKQTASDTTPNCTAGTILGSAVAVTNGVVANSATKTLDAAGTYEFWAVYSGDANNITSTSTCGTETVVVPLNTTTTATQVKKNSDNTNIADGGSVAIGTVVYDTATLSGQTATAGGTVSYYVQKQTASDTTPNCTAGTILGSAVAVTNGVVANSATKTLDAAGTYEFWAVYSGDANNITSTSTCGTETVVVPLNTTTTATQVKKNSDNTNIADGGSVAIGTVVYDTATLSGQTATAGGTVSYYVQKQTASDTTPNCTAGTILGSAVAVTNGVVANSATKTLDAAGTYEFWAVYSGDANNITSTSTCGTETVVVPLNTTTTATQVKKNSDNTNIADGGSVAIGTVVYDTATLSGQTATAGGTVSYYVQKQTASDTTPNCTAGTILGSAVAVTNGVVANSATKTLDAAGTYEFWAVYSGDANNITSTSTCGTETVVVSPNAPAPHSTPVVQIKDTLTVTGFTSDATGSVLVGLYSDATCTTQVGTNSTFAVSSSVSGTLTAETSFVAVLSGTYSYKISYAGDGNNSAFSSCEERVVVTITAVP